MQRWWAQAQIRPHQVFPAIGCVIAGLVVAAMGPAVSFSVSEILGRSAPVIHVIGVFLAVGGVAITLGVARNSLPAERVGSFIQGFALGVYALLLLLARQWWAGPIIAGLAVAGFVKGRATASQLRGRTELSRLRRE